MSKISVSFQLLPQTESQLQYKIVDDVLELLQSAEGIEYVVGPMDTVIEGDHETIIELIQESFKLAHAHGVKTVFSYLKIVSSSEEIACGFLEGVKPAMERHNK